MNTILQRSTSYTDHIPLNSLPSKFRKFSSLLYRTLLITWPFC